MPKNPLLKRGGGCFWGVLGVCVFGVWCGVCVSGVWVCGCVGIRGFGARGDLGGPVADRGGFRGRVCAGCVGVCDVVVWCVGSWRHLGP